MSLNWVEIDLILSELSLVGKRIRKIIQPDFSSLVFELTGEEGNFSLLVSLASGAVRLHRFTIEVAAPPKLQRFAQFLRSRVRGGLVREARQVGDDRIIRIDIGTGEQRTLLWIRLWSGAANVIATDAEGMILDAFYRRPARGEVTGGHFLPDESSLREGRKTKTYSIRELPGEGSFNERIETFYRSTDGHGDLESLRARAAELLDERERRARSTLAELEDRLSESDQMDHLKVAGDHITTNLHRLKMGDRWLEENDDDALRIALNPRITPAANAAAYYEKFKKARSGRAKVEREIEVCQGLLAALASDRANISSVESPDELADYARKLERHLQTASNKKESADSGWLEYRSGPYTLLVGRSAKENDRLLRRHVKGNDYWLHARDVPGAYIFIRALPGKSPPLETLLDAGNLALFYSKARSGGHAEVYYTQAKHLKRPRGGKLGLVIPTNEKNLSIRLDEERLERLFDGGDAMLGSLGELSE